VSEFEKVVTFRAAFDRCADDPKRNYGIHGVEIRFVLKGPLGATQFLLYTNWMLPVGSCPISGTHQEGRQSDVFYKPMPADLGYHAPRPQYESQVEMECDVLPGGRCYYDGSIRRAESVYERLLREGDAGVWATLEDDYRLRFEMAVAS